MTSQFLLKGHKMLNFLFAFFLKIYETLEPHIWNGNRYQQMVKSFLFGFQRSFVLAINKVIKTFDA